jgi:UV excision repair protein RAD23
MKLILKNLKQVEFEIQIESNSITVKALKKEIEKLYSFDSDQIKILFSGIILEDQKVLSEYNIIENSTIIIMNLKPKKNSNTENKTSNVNENKDITQNKMQVQNNPKQDIAEILKDNLKIQVDSLVDMGFERSQVEIAVKAANGRIDLAIDYLNNGIPDKNRNRNRNNNNNQRNNNNSQNEIMKELKKQAGIIKVLCKDNKYMIFTILNNIKRNDPGLLRLITDYRDEFEKLLDAPITEEDERYYKSIETKADEIIHKRLEEKAKKIQELANKNKENQNEPNKEENKEESDNKKNEENKDVSNKPEEKEKEKSDTDINKEEGNKENKENMEIEEEKKSDKKENQNENIDKKDKDEEKVNENIENKENTNIDLNNNNSNNNNPIQNQLTEEDNQVIERLKNLGDFSREKVIEAYIVCNKNEELTANYLFEQYN